MKRSSVRPSVRLSRPSTAATAFGEFAAKRPPTHTRLRPFFQDYPGEPVPEG